MLMKASHFKKNKLINTFIFQQKVEKITLKTSLIILGYLEKRLNLECSFITNIFKIISLEEHSKIQNLS
jgi:hypothetical protein